MNQISQMWKQIPWAKMAAFIPGISFLWPMMLFLLLIVPIAVGVYVWMLYRRKRFAVRYGNMALVRQAATVPAWRRHVPPILFLAALTMAIVAIARPTAEVTLPSTRATVILTMDV